MVNSIQPVDLSGCNTQAITRSFQKEIYTVSAQTCTVLVLGTLPY